MNRRLEALDAARSRPGQTGPWDYVSPSRLNLWLRCPLAFKLLCGLRRYVAFGWFPGKYGVGVAANAT